MKYCHHLQASVSVKLEGHMQRPWGTEEAIRKVLLMARVDGAGRRKKKKGRGQRK